MKITPQIKTELVLLYKGMGIVNVIVFAISLFTGFKLSFLFGLIIGYIYICWNLYYLGYTISKSVYKTQKNAKRYMRGNYILRYAILVLIFGIAFNATFISTLGVVIPLFYPKIVLGFNVLKGRR